MSWRHDPISCPAEFRIVWSRIREHQAFMDAPAMDKAAFLKFAIDVLKADILGSSVSNILFEEAEADTLVFPLDLMCKPSEIKEIPFKGNTVLSFPYERGRLLDAVVDIAREGFRVEKNIFEGSYYPEINLIIIDNGRHHSAVASISGGGSAKTHVFRLSDAFDHISTDGVYWFNDKAKEYAVKDVRFALLYEFAKEIAALPSLKNPN